MNEVKRTEEDVCDILETRMQAKYGKQNNNKLTSKTNCFLLFNGEWTINKHTTRRNMTIKKRNERTY